MRIEYEYPEMEVILFHDSDVIVTSGDEVNPAPGWWNGGTQKLGEF